MSNIIGHHVAPIPNFSGHPAFVLVVLTEGGARDYAAYAGIVPLPGGEPGSPGYDSGHRDYPAALAAGMDRVAASGTKLRYEEAKRHFPMLPADRYRA